VTTMTPPTICWLMRAKSTWAPSRIKMNSRMMKAVVAT
jgi:hypothetical protein